MTRSLLWSFRQSRISDAHRISFVELVKTKYIEFLKKIKVDFLKSCYYYFFCDEKLFKIRVLASEVNRQFGIVANAQGVL